MLVSNTGVQCHENDMHLFVRLPSGSKMLKNKKKKKKKDGQQLDFATGCV